MIDWTRLLAESFRQFMTEEGIDSSTLKDKLSPELLKRFLEKFIGTADPDQLRRQLADAPGTVGFFISFMLAMPAEGRFASVLVLSEVMKAAGLPIPHGVRTAVIAAFEATGEAGVTDEDIRRYRSRVLSAVSGITPGMALAAGAALAGAAVVAALSSRNSEPQIEPAPPVLEDHPMSTPPDPSDPTLTSPPPVAPPVIPPVVVSSPAVIEPPEPTDPNKIRFLDFLAAIKPLREAEVIELPRRPTEYWRGVAWVRKHLHDKNLESRRRARRAFDLLPVDLTEDERKKLKDPIDKLFQVRGPRTKRPSVADRRDHAEKVHVMFNRASAWEEEVRQIGRDEAWFWQRHFTIPLADKLDDMVNDDVRGTVMMLAHLAIITLAGVIAALPLESDDFVERSGIIRLALCGGLIGASVYMLIKQAVSSSEIVDRLYTGKNLDGTERDKTQVEVLGTLAMIISVVVGTIGLTLWLAPGFTPLAFVLNCCFFGIWGAPFAILSQDPWVNKIEPIFVGADGKPVDKYGKPLTAAHHEEEHAKEEGEKAGSPAEAKKAHGKEDKGHAHGDHAKTEEDSVDQMLEDKSKRQGLVVPGQQRPGNLKISLGGTLVGMCMNILWSFTGEALPSKGAFVAGFFLMLTILTVAQYFGALLPVKWMQKFIQSNVVGPAIYPIVGMFALAFLLAGLFSDRGQLYIVESVHARTDEWLEVPKLPEDDNAGSSQIVTKSKLAEQTYVRTTTVTRTSTCTERDWLEEQSAGFCVRNPHYIGCKCE